MGVILGEAILLREFQELSDDGHGIENYDYGEVSLLELYRS
ncbi:uncharacterized protein G2W53_001818 [Senna tora]|uniref:Uncharacterized protein n=1 Tax=Senna tora TaxID=362788 RepID=A0A834XGH3_9FABA|nr:uncharacterized protein G2W53_001818 [Senna tora]